MRFDSAQDFLDKGKELLDTKEEYVLEPAYTNDLLQFAMWHGLQNKWAMNGGKLTYMFETDEYFAGLEFALKCQEAKLFWPDPNLPTTLEKIEGASSASTSSPSPASSTTATCTTGRRRSSSPSPPSPG